MNRILLTVAAAALAGGFAVAQVQAQVVVTLEPQVRTELREYVVVRGEPAVAVADFDVAVGTVVPETVELRMIEGIPAVAEYRYVLVENRILLVDPGTRVIVSVIEPNDNGEGTEAAAEPAEPDTENGAETDGEDDANGDDADGEGEGGGAN
jgi:hypothetical protein